MHVVGVNLDLSLFLQLIATVFVAAVGLLYLVKNTASKYFEVEASFEGDQVVSGRSLMDDSSCFVCGGSGPKKCSRCKAVRYCSQKCQQKHWNSGHKNDCKVFQPSRSLSSAQNGSSNSHYKASNGASKSYNGIALVPARGISKPVNTKQLKEILFPYDEFVKLFSWDRPGFPACGLVNCGNSCFVNVILQCLASTRPLVAYLLEKGHRSECIRCDWCFLCELQTHIERVSQSSEAFTPSNIISRLPNIGGNLGCGRQEDAHEFMRFAIDTMQSVCLDEFGGEKAVPPSLQETTLIQHVFGGHLQSQVICTECNNASNQYENMMDLTVEIHGEATSLEECLDLFTTAECLQGENMYKCDGCNDYVKAWKRLTIKQPPNILTIALKRFQSGRFGKLNKRVTFPETLDLSPYTNDAGDSADIYKLYAVVVHVDTMNASFFGHYICYVKDLSGNWHRIDDCKVARVDLEEVLSQGAYMLLYSRVKARPSCLRALEPPKEQQRITNGIAELSPKEHVKECFANGSSGPVPSNGSLCLETSENESPIHANSYAITKHLNNNHDGPNLESMSCVASKDHSGQEEDNNMGISSCPGGPSTPNGFDKVSLNISDDRDSTEVIGFSAPDRQSGNGTYMAVGCESSSLDAKDVKIYSNGHVEADDSAMKVEEDGCIEVESGLHSLASVNNSGPEIDSLKWGSGAYLQNGNGIKSVDIIMDDSS